MIRNPVVSVIVPIYNTDKYLAEALDSIIAQTIGFEDYVELILINDGSPDESEKICLEYKEKFPENIVYIKQENSGVSSARNNGLSHATGEFVQFFDPDDKLSLNTLENTVSFFRKHDDIDVVSIPIYFFDAMQGPHPNNNKFDDGTRIVDLSLGSTRFIQSNVVTTLLRKSAIKNIKFDLRLKYGEDGKFVNELLWSHLRMGLVAEAGYHYRKRGDGTSAVDSTTRNKNWYFGLIEHYLIEIAEKARESYGSIPRYVQNIILHDLRWRFEQRDIPAGVLTSDEEREYKELIRKSLQYIDDEVILDSLFIRRDLRLYILQYKHNMTDYKSLELHDDGRVSFNNTAVSEIVDKEPLFIDLIHSSIDSLIIEGWYGGVLGGYRTLRVRHGDKELKIALSERKTDTLRSIGDVYKPKIAFTLHIPFKDIRTNSPVEFSLSTPTSSKQLYMNFGYHSRVSNLSHAYKSIGDYLIKVLYTNGIPGLYVQKSSLINKLTSEVNVSARILARKDIMSFGARIVGGLIKYGAKLFGKEIWLFIDRPLSATDNGFAMFEYVVNLKRRDIIPVLILSKDAKDYEKLKKIGRVVDYNGAMYRLWLYTASKMLSSHFDEFAYNPFGYRHKHMRIGLSFDFIYLQHGVLAADLSDLINKYKRNIQLITTSSQKETKAIVSNPDYGYGEREIVTTGQARFDILYGHNSSTAEKLIAFAPTWRFNLFTGPASVDGKVIPGRNKQNKNFTDSEYFKFYNRLINDERIQHALHETGYTAVYCVHPQLSAQATDFDENDKVKVLADYDYNDILRRAAVLVTDYSGIAFDFAFMKKPIIYTQFDADEFYNSHTYNADYFSFKKDGFGPVHQDYELSVKEIVGFIHSKDMQMAKKYQHRTDKFFAHIDNQNRNRIFKKIIDQDNN